MNRVSLDTLLKRLTHACYGAGALVTLTLSWFLIQGFSARSNAGGVTQMATVMRKRLEEDRTKIDKARNLRDITVVNGLEAVGAFQSRFETLAQKHRVEVTEFRSSTEMGPFLSAYAKDTNSEGWMQVDTKTTIRGRLVDVMGCLTDLSHERVPFEFDTVELTRVVGEPGSVLVNAGVQMRVLTKPGKDAKL